MNKPVQTTSYFTWRDHIVKSEVYKECVIFFSALNIECSFWSCETTVFKGPQLKKVG